MIILPVQRVQMAFGVRKSWLDKVGEKFPNTWADVQRVAVKFRDNDPDGDGKANTFGMALEAAKPRDLIHMLDLFMFGSGLRHTLIDPQGKIVVDEPAHAKVLRRVHADLHRLQICGTGYHQPFIW
jgi:ABC-type glycerol-3-phosphate transport system substrate-binding protein